MTTVLIVDDSEVACHVLAKEISKAPDLQVVGTAHDAFAARDEIFRLRPDVITLDLEMPRMNGLTFLGKLMTYYPLPVVVVSSQTSEGSDAALQALELGAVEVLGKPARIDSSEFGAAVVDKIRAAAAARCFKPKTLRPPIVQQIHAPLLAGTPYSMIAVGASTGGTEAIRTLLTSLPATTPGLLITQHMPEAFVERFAKRLDSFCALEVRVAEHGDHVTPGLALIAPGNRHLTICARGGRHVVQLVDGPAVHHQRPSVDVLFHSVAGAAADRAMGILLTGMGVDGARGLRAMREAGARTFAQDEASCVVFGMPKEAIRLDAAEHIVSLERLAPTLLEMLERPGRLERLHNAMCGNNS